MTDERLDKPDHAGCCVFTMGTTRIPYRKPAGTTWDQLQEALLRALGK